MSASRSPSKDVSLDLGVKTKFVIDIYIKSLIIKLDNTESVQEVRVVWTKGKNTA